MTINDIKISDDIKVLMTGVNLTTFGSASVNTNPIRPSTSWSSVLKWKVGMTQRFFKFHYLMQYIIMYFWSFYEEMHFINPLAA